MQRKRLRGLAGLFIDSLRDGATHKQTRIKQMQTFMLVMTIFTTNGHREDIALGFQLSYHDCAEIAATIEPVLANDAADIWCELEGVNQ